MEHYPEQYAGHIIGIVLTFGTTFALQRCEQQKTERTAALMVIHNLDYFCESLEENIKDLPVGGIKLVRI